MCLIINMCYIRINIILEVRTYLVKVGREPHQVPSFGVNRLRYRYVENIKVIIPEYFQHTYIV